LQNGSNIFRKFTRIIYVTGFEMFKLENNSFIRGKFKMKELVSCKHVFFLLKGWKH
jgi:hypothetical protein